MRILAATAMLLAGLLEHAAAIELSRLPVIEGKYLVTANHVAAMTEQIPGWTGGKYVTHDIYKVNGYQINNSDFACSFVFVLDRDGSQITCFHMDGESRDYDNLGALGRRGNGATYRLYSPRGFDVHNILTDNGKTIVQYIFIADTGNNRVKRINHTTHVYDVGGYRQPDVWNWLSSDFADEEFRTPWGVSCAPASDPYIPIVCVSESLARRIRFFYGNGNALPAMDVLSETPGMPSYLLPREVELIRSGGVYKLAYLADSDGGDVRQLVVLEYDNGQWVLRAQVDEPEAIDISHSSHLGFVVLRSNGEMAFYNESGLHVVDIDLSGDVPSGVPLRSLSVDRDQVIVASEYRYLQGGLQRYKVTGGIAHAATNAYGYVADSAVNVEASLAVLTPGWYSIDVLGRNFVNQYLVPNWSPRYIGTGAYSISIESLPVSWNEESVVRFSRVTGQSDLTPIEAVSTVPIQVFSPPVSSVLEPQAETFLDGSEATLTIRCEGTPDLYISRAEVWLEARSGTGPDTTQGFVEDLGYQRGEIDIDFVWPTYSTETCEVDWGLKVLLFLRTPTGEIYEDWAYAYDGEPLFNTVICSEPPDGGGGGGGKPPPCEMPCFVAGRFINGKRVYVPETPITSSARVYCALSLKVNEVSVYDVRGREVMRLPLRPIDENMSGTYLNVSDRRISSGVYFIRPANANSDDTEKVVIVK